MIHSMLTYHAHTTGPDRWTVRKVSSLEVENVDRAFHQSPLGAVAPRLGATHGEP